MKTYQKYALYKSILISDNKAYIKNNVIAIAPPQKIHFISIIEFL